MASKITSFEEEILDMDYFRISRYFAWEPPLVIEYLFKFTLREIKSISQIGVTKLFFYCSFYYAAHDLESGKNSSM